MTPGHAKNATWFCPGGAPLFGVLEYPADRVARGGVVVVPSLGVEQVTTHRGARALTERLVEAGFATLRYDHPGTGSSTGEYLSPTAFADWCRAVSSAVDALAERGLKDITVVGIRAGCIIADSSFAHERPAARRLVLWDPPASGRRFLREHTSKYRLSLGGDEPGAAVSILGGRLSASTAAGLRRATWSPGNPVSLVAARPGVLAGGELTPLLRPGVATVVLTQADSFVSPPAFVHHVPARDIDAIVCHLSDLAGPRTHLVDPAPVTRAVVARRADGSHVIEEIRTLTDRDLQVITTYVEGDHPRGGIVFQSTALEPPWGPAGAWVRAARENAGHGLVCVRFDQTGSGETGRIDPAGIGVLYSHESRRDSWEVVESLGMPTRRLLMVGLCSGAWTAAETAIRTRAGAVLLFGMIQWSRSVEPVTLELLRSRGYDPQNPVFRAPGWSRSRLKPVASRLLPYRAWAALGRRGITQVPGPLLADLMRAGVRTTVGLTPQDEAHFVAHRGDDALRRLRRTGFRGRVQRIPASAGDHDLYRPEARSTARRMIREEADALRGRLGLPIRPPTDRPLRILFVNENIGGHATVHSALRRALADDPGVYAEFLDATGPGLAGRILRAPIPGLAGLDLDLQPLRGQLVHSRDVRRRVRDRLGRGDIDAVHVYTQNCMLGGARILRRVPTVITTDSTGLRNAHSIPYRTPTRFTAAASRAALHWERPVLRAAHHVLANSVPVLESLTSRDYGLPADDVSLLRLGVWSPFLCAPLPERSPRRRPTVVFVGTSMERKGGSLLLEVWRSRLRDRCDLMLITLDAVREEPGLRVVRDLSPGDDRLWELLAEADIMCFPSLIDQAPNAVLEAAAAGLPVIAHPTGAIPEMVLNGRTGLLVDGADPAAVGRAVETLVDDPALRRRMGEAGAAHVRRHYSIVRSAETIVATLRAAVECAEVAHR